MTLETNDPGPCAHCGEAQATRPCPGCGQAACDSCECIPRSPVEQRKHSETATATDLPLHRQSGGSAGRGRRLM